MSDTEAPPVVAADPLPLAKSKCEQCNIHDAKYKCPSCLFRTCSLSCSKQHKASSGCSGERDRSKFVKRAEYDANTLMSDYGFLQDLARDCTNLSHDAEEQGVKGRQPAGTVLTRAQKNIMARAKSERQVIIRYMSPGIQRHKANKTLWASSRSRLVWTVEVVVPEIEAGLNKWIETGFHDVCRVGDLWTKLLQSGRCARQANDLGDEAPPRKRARNDPVRIQLASDDGVEHPFSSAIPLELLQTLKSDFGQTPIEDLVWLIRVQDTPANKPTFSKINPSEPLYTQLRYQTVLEFPTVYVYKQAPAEIGGHTVTIEEPRVSSIETEVSNTPDAPTLGKACESESLKSPCE
ncbi:Box C/D snoRNA accumulation [Coemansia sp. IMI 209128]|nr:Box C/D snoRNA accumulation [Coemansia sp. RSA 2530]KAJ2692689.1 Box C/D snoRNA accumulation [Coemansia sp. IMI 209128]